MEVCMTPGTTNVETVNHIVAEEGINASVTSLPLSHQNVPAEIAAEDLMAEAEAEATQNSSNSNNG